MFRVLALLLPLGASAVIVPGPDQAIQPKSSTVGHLVADLGHPQYAVREKAERELWQRGNAARGALEKALGHENPEIVRRARGLLDKLSWGIRPDTPPAVLKLLRQFQAGDPDFRKNAEVRRQAVRELLEQGASGISITRALLAKDFPAELRQQLVDQATALLRREVPRRLFENKLGEAAELISLHSVGTGAGGAADYAVFQLLRGKLPEAISALESVPRSGGPPAAQRLLLTHLYRASGNWEKARAIAADLPAGEEGPSPLEFLREEEGDWSRLADTLHFEGMNHPEAARLTMMRLAGRWRQFEEGARRLESGGATTAEETFDTAVALFANHRAAAATRLLLEKKQNPGLLAEVLMAQLRYREALALLVDPETIAPDELIDLGIRRARALMLTGERDRAVELLRSAAAQLRKRDARSPSFRLITAVRSLLRTEMRLGLRDLAVEHAELFVRDGVFARHERASSGETAFEILFGPDAGVAETLHEALRRKTSTGGNAGSTMALIRDLISGRAGKEAVDEALQALRDATQVIQFSNSEVPLVSADVWNASKHLATATVCRAAGRDAEADAAFKLAADQTADRHVAGARTWVYGVSDAHRPFVEWGDFLCDRGRSREAAARLLEGWKKFPEHPLLLFLSGRALARAGGGEEGDRRMELSHWVALGQERIRGKFLEELVRRGEVRAAKREIDLVLRGCWSRDHYFGNVMNQTAQAAVLNRDFTTAEKCRQRSLLVILKTPDVYFVELSAYMNVPHDLLVYRARSLLAAGKIKEAMALAREIQSVTPGHLALVCGMVPELEALGQKDEANEIFHRAWAAYQKMLKEFPASAFARHALATLAANCRRELDAGLALANEAVATEPRSIPYREVLAEVHFVRGNRARAVELMTKLVSDEPRNHYFKRQIERYRTGAFTSLRPPRAD